MHWIILIVAGLFEVIWAATMKKTDGFTRLGPSLLTLGAMAVSIYLLSVALRHLPASTGYAVWVGIGAVGTALIGILFLHEPRNALRLLSIALIVAGVIGLRLADPG